MALAAMTEMTWKKGENAGLVFIYSSTYTAHVKGHFNYTNINRGNIPFATLLWLSWVIHWHVCIFYISACSWWKDGRLRGCTTCAWSVTGKGVGGTEIWFTIMIASWENMETAWPKSYAVMILRSLYFLVQRVLASIWEGRRKTHTRHQIQNDD